MRNKEIDDFFYPQNINKSSLPKRSKYTNTNAKHKLNVRRTLTLVIQSSMNRQTTSVNLVTSNYKINLTRIRSSLIGGASW